MVKVSIIILTKNAGGRFKLLLERIYSQTFKNFEVLIIDSGSRDSTLKIAKKYKTRIYRIRPEEFHHSITRNLGANLAKGEIIVYITQDALPINNFWLRNLITPLKSMEDVAAVYGRQVAYPDAKPMEKFFYNSFYPNQMKMLTKKDIENPKRFYLDNIFVSDVNSAIKKDAWKKIRFRKEIFMAEDKDFALRALSAGYKIIYEPKAMVYHSHNYSIISAFKRRFADGMAFNLITSNYNSFLNRDYSIRVGLEYFRREMTYLLRNYKLWLPYALIYNAAKLLGFELGKRKCSLIKD